MSEIHKIYEPEWGMSNNEKDNEIPQEIACDNHHCAQLSFELHNTHYVPIISQKVMMKHWKI
jgi:hypothetical protein